MKDSTAPPSFLIRRARTADLDAIHRLNRELQTYERTLRLSRLPARFLPRDHVDRLWRIDQRNAGRLFVAALIERAQEYARHKNAGSIGVTALAENATARRVYRTLGFVESAVTFERRISTRTKLNS
jgi:hypothetical protein